MNYVPFESGTENTVDSSSTMKYLAKYSQLNEGFQRRNKSTSQHMTHTLKYRYLLPVVESPSGKVDSLGVYCPKGGQEQGEKTAIKSRS